MRAFNVDDLQTRLEQAQLAHYIYNHEQQILVLQDPLTDQGKILNIFVQHELSSDQLGLQFALQLTDQGLQFLIAATYSNQNRQYEIGAGNLKGIQKAFNLLYAFYNYPKALYIVTVPFAASTAQLEQALQQQLFDLPELQFIHSASKINPMGQQVQWIKDYILQQTLDMKVRMQTALL